LYAAANLGEDDLERMDELGTLACTINSLNVEVDEAFTPSADSMFLFEADEPARGVALYHKYRMHEQADLKAAAGRLDSYKNGYSRGRSLETHRATR